ncbi:hypothetical protein BH09BAC1_BH09BAC1_22840 [soil metagenome]
MKANQLLLVLLAFALSFTACEKPKKVDYELLASDANISESINSDAYRIVDQESRSGGFSDNVGKTSSETISWVSSVDTCAMVTLNTNGGSFPMTLTIDFGTGCTDSYNITRKGKVIGVFSGFYTVAGSRIDVSFNNYYVNNHKVEGNKTITNQGRNAQQKLAYQVVDANGRITKPDGGIITWESTRTHVWDSGESTLLWIYDDVYAITGTASGEISDGTPYGIRTITPVKKMVICPYLSEGSITYSVDGDDIATVDYGNGACDATANLTYDGKTYVIIIK